MTQKNPRPKDTSRSTAHDYREPTAAALRDAGETNRKPPCSDAIKGGAAAAPQAQPVQSR